VNKIDLLFIRACKSQRGFPQVVKVYNRFYYSEFDYKHLTIILTRIVTEHSLTTPFKIIEGLDPRNAWKYGATDCTYYEQVCKFMISEIRLTEVSKFPYYPTPARLRKRGS
jgi:hypothetical protein